MGLEYSNGYVEAARRKLNILKEPLSEKDEKFVDAIHRFFENGNTKIDRDEEVGTSTTFGA